MAKARRPARGILTDRKHIFFGLQIGVIDQVKRCGRIHIDTRRGQRGPVFTLQRTNAATGQLVLTLTRLKRLLGGLLLLARSRVCSISSRRTVLDG